MTIIRIRKGYFAHAALLGAALSVVGCAGDLPAAFDDAGGGSGNSSGSSSGSGSGSSSGPPCADVPTVTFPMSCATSTACHVAANSSPTSVVFGLDLVSPNVASRLVGVKSGEPSAPPGTLLINPGNPSQSAIYTKLSMSAPYGLPMPFGMPSLDAATQMCILQYAMKAAAMAPAGGSSSSGGGSSEAGTTPVTDGGGGGSTNGG
jgi:hypothetical protein